MTDLAGKRVTVMGLGRFGGGIGVTRWLCSQGADVLVTDKDTPEELADSVAQIRPLVDSGRVTLRLGEHNVGDFTACGLVVANAAVPKPWANRYLRSAEAAGIPITTEITLTMEHLIARGVRRTVGITGSVGKSTTTAMIHHALSRSLDGPGASVVMGGNIGGSLLGELHAIDRNSIVVLELSSAMLHWLGRTLNPAWSPHVAVVTNISANHLDWHGDFAHYAASKKRLIESQSAGDATVLGDTIWDWREATRATCSRIDSGAFPLPLKLPGEHNRVNAAAALAACVAVAPELDRATLAREIADFPGLAHRLQLVAEAAIGGGGGASGEPMRFYNDSKSTTPESAIKAVEAIAAMPGMSLLRLHLIAGGYDKGSDLTPVAKLGGELGGLYTIGVTGPAIADASGGHAHPCATVDQAVATALARMRPGDALLLSPGCASWDQYANFEERGDEFVRLVREAVGR
jgi:UDP-N-acetylmuramoylalanine--D-glutamate ligase